KIAADRMCYAYIQTYGMNICIMRPFNIFGPRQKDSGYGGVISIFTRRVLSNIPPIIYGDGWQTRDYTYIDDIVRAYDSIFSCDESITEPVNFGSGREIRIVDLANMIIDLCDRNGSIQPVHVEQRPGEVKRLIADTTKAKNLLKWEPKYTLEEGLRRFIDWYKDYKFEEWTKPG
ncbi:MAG: GDP-mannose 4,6-dehydratase, partial [Dehalococcoidia bacterium]|nr:GDP-mannose 4,6-dehydratase [Dehalococcoidia bacterium]